MTDARHGRGADALDRPARAEIVRGRGRAAPAPTRPHPPAARRSTARCARSRTTSCAWAASSRTQIRAAIDALVDHDAEAASAVIVGDGRINEAQRHIVVARSPRPSRPSSRSRATCASCCRSTTSRYELERMGDHAGVGRQAGPQAGARAAAQASTSTCPRWASSRPQQVHGVLRALVDIDEARRARSRPGTTRSTPLPPIFDEVARADARRPGQRRARHADPVRGALPRAHRRPGHEHRRGRRVPGHRRHRGPQPVTEPRAPDPGPVRLHRQLGAEHHGRGAAARRTAATDFEVHSAGTEPKGVNPLTMRVLEEAGIDASWARSKSVDRVPRPAVRLRHHRLRPGAPGAARSSPASHESLHWGYEDPAEATGTEDEGWPSFRHDLHPASASGSSSSSRSHCAAATESNAAPTPA